MKRVSLMLVLLFFSSVMFAGEKFSRLPDAPDYEKATQAEVEKYILNHAFESYFYLLSFKDDPEFIVSGLLDTDGPYYPWYQEAGDFLKYCFLAASQFGVDMQDRKNVIYRLGEIIRDLGLIYNKSKGRETDESLEIKDGLGNLYGKSKYRKPVRPTPIRF